MAEGFARELRGEEIDAYSAGVEPHGMNQRAVQVMRELGVYQIPTVGLAKRFEELFVPDEEEPIVLPRGSEALYLVQRALRRAQDAMFAIG